MAFNLIAALCRDNAGGGTPCTSTSDGDATVNSGVLALLSSGLLPLRDKVRSS
eukprot:CAMPEP_0205925062 /NCGR_PEP_ID=MMETSP1325-20131115/17337_1 /ASSEMBLY_ACC=CAM_ASM_000708 /TAXON_ID=236786 /ORGANISM="Florenciella sp., Strain RCC1007" /LENGTH=52 /DNA_ID=CAMNT_0053293517 /DNA_START=24 /DNA_END=178 /DNA_ORIENTATION=-